MDLLRAYCMPDTMEYFKWPYNSIIMFMELNFLQEKG